MSARDSLKVLELYCGIGGCAAALMDAAVEIVAAVDVNTLALATYRQNHPHLAIVRLIDTLTPAELEAFGADCWWASPPCQPFTRRGRRKDLEDPRARTFLTLLDKLAIVKPRWFAMENVVGFEQSDARERLMATLERAGYVSFREFLLCPSDFGVPNRRPRYYALAALDALPPSEEPHVAPRTLSDVLGAELESMDADAELHLDPSLLKRYDGALHIVQRHDPSAVTRCFTSAYGRSHVRSGSFLATEEGGARRFSPSEILRLLGFPSDYTLPDDLPRKNAWRLVGNSLSLEPVCHVMSALTKTVSGAE